ncbi:MAG: zinc ribbon domain-containing protein [Polyangiaceae bacterium]|jgi:putative FmdB family regulatory protein|nr:zinc ribbon domain-containing protein [Polyangiaceae bacterium]
MPTYEYKCSACNHEWEAEQRIVEAPLDTCPACREKTARRLISGASFILKGGGWYADLYSSASKKNDAKRDAAVSSPTSTSSSGSESKSETKKESSLPRAQAPSD